MEVRLFSLPSTTSHPLKRSTCGIFPPISWPWSQDWCLQALVCHCHVIPGLLLLFLAARSVEGTFTGSCLAVFSRS